MNDVQRISKETSSFVLLSAPRSGTSLFMTSLRQHPDIYCHGEIFHPTPKWHVLPEYVASAGSIDRESDPVSFVKSILSFSPGPSITGFKMWRMQSVEACEYVMSDTSIKKVVLDRPNRLATYSSLVAAKQTGVWNHEPGQPAELLKKSRDQQISFDPVHFKRYVSDLDEMFDTYKSDCQGKVLHLDYKDVSTSDFGEIFNFLEIEKIGITQKKMKLLSPDILSRFEPSSHDLIHMTLNEIGKEEWVLEDS